MCSPVHGLRTQRRKRNVTCNGNYSVVGLEEKELGFEMK
jgi:hypothetical protein